VSEVGERVHLGNLGDRDATQQRPVAHLKTRRLVEGLVLAVTFSLIAWGGLILLAWFLM
jgi:hypothetical protein